MLHWNVSPIIFSAGPLQVRWYGLLFALGFVLGFQYVKRRFLEGGKAVELLDSLLGHLFAGTILGARLGHCLFYEPDVYLKDPLRILKIWEGGLASHGGAIGVLLAIILFARRNPTIPLLWLLDRLMVPIAFTGAFIRLGNLMNSEIIGRPTDLPWGVVFERVDAVARHPAMVYESLGYMTISLTLHLLFRTRDVARRPGMLFGIFLILLFGFRFFIEFIKEHQVDFEAALPLDMGQLLSLPFVLGGAILLARALKRPPEAAA